MSVALPDNVVNGKNVDNETWFHARSHSYLILLIILILIDSQHRLLRDC